MVTLWRPRDCPVLERGVWVRLQRGFPIEQELGLGDKKIRIWRRVRKGGC